MAFSDPTQNIQQFRLREGMSVADLGAGTGFYSIAAARAIGGTGKIYAIEVQKDFLAKIKDEAERVGLTNIEIIWGDIERVGGTKLKDSSVDAAIVSNVLFQISDKKSFLEEVYRIVKPGGKVLVVDWSDSFGGLGPTPTNIISEESSKMLFQDSGFEFIDRIQAGEHHYGFIVKKPV